MNPEERRRYTESNRDAANAGVCLSYILVAVRSDPRISPLVTGDRP